jgi:hypothetical protein
MTFLQSARHAAAVVCCGEQASCKCREHTTLWLPKVVSNLPLQLLASLHLVEMSASYAYNAREHARGIKQGNAAAMIMTGVPRQNIWQYTVITLQIPSTEHSVGSLHEGVRWAVWEMPN